MIGFGMEPFFGGFALFGIFFGVVFLLVIGVFVFALVKGLSTWNKNNQSPIHIKDLIRYILDTRTLSGNYNNIDYTCELDTQNNVPYKIIWGNITVEFAYFE